LADVEVDTMGTRFLAAAKAKQKNVYDVGLLTIIDGGGSPDVVDVDGNCAVAYLAAAGNFAMVQWCLVTAGCQRLRFKDGSTLLHIAAKNGFLRLVVWLLSTGPRGGAAISKTCVEDVDDNGMNAVLHACSGSHCKVVEAMVAAGATITAADNEGLTAMMHVASSPHLRYEGLWEEDAGGPGDVEQQLLIQENGRLMELLMQRHPEGVYDRDLSGRTLLMVSLSRGYASTVLYVIDCWRGALHEVNNEGENVCQALESRNSGSSYFAHKPYLEERLAKILSYNVDCDCTPDMEDFLEVEGLLTYFHTGMRYQALQDPFKAWMAGTMTGFLKIPAVISDIIAAYAVPNEDEAWKTRMYIPNPSSFRNPWADFRYLSELEVSEDQTDLEMHARRGDDSTESEFEPSDPDVSEIAPFK
jgi:hypothetical protein